MKRRMGAGTLGGSEAAAREGETKVELKYFAFSQRSSPYPPFPPPQRSSPPFPPFPPPIFFYIHIYKNFLLIYIHYRCIYIVKKKGGGGGEEGEEGGRGGRSSPANLCMQAPPAKLARFSLCENFACRCASAKRRAKVNLKNFKHFCIFTKRS